MGCGVWEEEEELSDSSFWPVKLEGRPCHFLVQGSSGGGGGGYLGGKMDFPI